MEKTNTKFTILMFPWLAYSHVFPFLELSKRLSKRNFHIYFCSSAINLDSIRKSLKNDESIDLIELHIPSSPQLPSHLHTTKNLPSNLKNALQQAFQMSFCSFSEIMENLKPDLLVYDFFQPWAAKLAISQGIPSVYFATSGAAPFSFFHHLFHIEPSSAFPYKELYLLDHEREALRVPFEPKVKDADEDDFAFGNFKLSSDIVLIKSLRGFEGKYIDYLSELCKKKVIPTGPLVDQEVHNNDDQENFSEISNWLSKKDEFSTVFICFGSEHFLSIEQIIEIAKGLELCEANFIWAIKFPEDEYALSLEDRLPYGFLDRVKERGLILQGWVPQAKILTHRSVGGFLSHCGWSSMTESLYFGVPVISMPIKYDQPINTRLVVEAGAGVEVERDANGLSRGEDVAKEIDKVMAEKTIGDGLRFRAGKLSEEMRGEEEQAADQAAEELLWLCRKSNQCG